MVLKLTSKNEPQVVWFFILNKKLMR